MDNAPNQVLVGFIIQKRKSNKYNIISPDSGPLLVDEFLFYFSESKKKKMETKTDWNEEWKQWNFNEIVCETKENSFLF